MGNVISQKRRSCLNLFKINQLRTDQIIALLNINNLKNDQILIDLTRIPNCKTKKEFTKVAEKYIKNCDEKTLNKIIKYLKRINSENDIIG